MFRPNDLCQMHCLFFCLELSQAQSQKAAYATLQQHADALALDLKTSCQETQAAPAKAAEPKALDTSSPEMSQAIASAAEAQVLAQLNREVEARTGPLVARCSEAEQKLRMAEEALAIARYQAMSTPAAATLVSAAANEQSPSSSSPRRRNDGSKKSSPIRQKLGSSSKREDWVRASALQACEDKLAVSDSMLLQAREQHAAAMSDLASSHEAELALLWQRYQAAVVAHQEEVASMQAELHAANERAVNTAKYLSAWREAEVEI